MGHRYNRDLSFGLGEENIIKPILEEYFGELKKLDKYNPFDFENDHFLIEVKSRRMNHNKYNTIMFNYSKIEKLEGYNTEKNAMFIFNCEDGIYYWEYDSTEFSVGRGGRCDRGCNEYSQMAYVDVNLLKPLITLPIFNEVLEVIGKAEEETVCKTVLDYFRRTREE
tara:strand:- start:11242 stop:11742 length:501 start_codon:yes stop_codon:yes gene_type:complete